MIEIIFFLTVYIVYLIHNIPGKYTNIIPIQYGSVPKTGSENRSCPEMGMTASEYEIKYIHNDKLRLVIVNQISVNIKKDQIVRPSGAYKTADQKKSALAFFFMTVRISKTKNCFKLNKNKLFQNSMMDCPDQVRDEVVTEPQENESIDEELLDHNDSEEEAEEQEEKVDRASKRVHVSEDIDVQRCAAGIAQVQVDDRVLCNTVRSMPGHDDPKIIDRTPEDPTSDFISQLMGVDNNAREAPVVDSHRASPMAIAGGLDPYAEFDPKFFTKSEGKKNPLNLTARADPHFLKLVDSKAGGVGDVTDDLVDRRSLVCELFRGKVNAFTKGSNPGTKVEFESTFDGNVCLACGPDLNGEYHGVAEDNRVVVLGDAHIPPKIGSAQCCLSVIRVIGGSPEQLADALLIVLGRQTKKTGTKRNMDGSEIKPKIHVLWSINSHIQRVGINCAIIDVGNAMSVVQNGLHKDYSSSLLVTPWGRVKSVESEKGNDFAFKSGANIKQNHALLLLSKALSAPGLTMAEHETIMTKGFTAATDEFPSGEAIEHEGIELHVRGSNPVLGNTRAMYLPDFLPKVLLTPGVLRDPGAHLALDPRAEFTFLTALVQELKNTQKFRMNFILPDNNQILYGVCQGIPLGKQSTKENVMMDALIAHAKRHHENLIEEGKAVIMFKAPGSGSTRFNDTGFVQVVGNSQAGKFAETFVREKRKLLAENNFSVDKGILDGGDQQTCSLHIQRIFSHPTLKKTKGTTVLWVLSNMMLKDRVRKGNFQIITESHAHLVQKGVLHPRKKKGADRWTNSNKGYVTGLRAQPQAGWKLACPIHTLAAKARSAMELGELMEDVLSRVRKLLSEGCQSIILVGPMPRHPEKCCLDTNSHMDSGYSPDEFNRMCYLMSTYMVGILRQKNVKVLHPGEIFGWGEMPDVTRFVGPDGVHLSDAGERAAHGIIRGRVNANKLEREKAEADGSPGNGASFESVAEEGKEVPDGSRFVKFAAGMVARSIHFSKPKFDLAGDF